VGQGKHRDNWAEQSGRGFKIHALERSSRVGGVVVRAYRLPGRFSKPLAWPFSMGVGVFYLQQRRALDYAKFPVRNAPAGVNEIKGLANQKISDPSNAEDLALAIQIVLHGKERPPCDGLFRLSFLLLFGFCQCPEALELEAYLHDLTAPEAGRVDLLVHQPCFGYGARVDGDG